MLRKIKISDLREGMIFSEPLFFDDGKNRVLGKNFPITKKELQVLKTWKVPFVMTEGKILKKEEVGKNEFSDVEEIEALSNDESQENSGAALSENVILQLPEILTGDPLYTEYKAIIDELDTFLMNIKQKNPVPARPIDKMAVKVHNLLLQNKELVLSFILSSHFPDKEMAKNLVDSALITDVITQFLKLPDEYVTEMVIAALIHDCGMLRIPDAIINKQGTLTETEMQAVAAHTVYGYKSALSEFMYTERIAVAVLQHHERWDGRGYPSGLNKDAITMGGRILAIVDAFIAMTSAKAYRKALLGYDAMKTLLADKGRRFDYEMIKVIIQTLGIYPIGSIVLMNNTSIARVVKAAAEAPLRPVIRILVDENGKKFPTNTGDLLDLREYKNIFIVKAIDPSAYQQA
ncbi:MAG: HD-GYP domain-containing protein [Treponema sp.]